MNTQIVEWRVIQSNVVDILGLIASRTLTHKQIGALYQVNGACIGRIATGEKWRHVPRPLNMPIRRVAKAAQAGREG